jgi:hypothetical protein
MYSADALLDVALAECKTETLVKASEVYASLGGYTLMDEHQIQLQLEDPSWYQPPKEPSQAKTDKTDRGVFVLDLFGDEND